MTLVFSGQIFFFKKAARRPLLVLLNPLTSDFSTHVRSELYRFAIAVVLVVVVDKFIFFFL